MAFDLNRAFEDFQRILRRHPLLVVGTGASCALDKRFGMEALRDKLREEIRPAAGSEEQQWLSVLSALDGKKGLEEALDSVTERGLLNRIIAITGAFVASVDHQWAFPVATKETPAPLTRLITRLVQGLPPTNPIQHIVTPNYDLIIEHTCDAEGVPFTDGFVAGGAMRRDWEFAANSMYMQVREPRGKSWMSVTRCRPHVRLHKVHGSINWFQDDDDERLLRYDRLTDTDAPVGWRRAMITPGRSKYAEAGIKREWFKGADEAIAGADAFLIVGYGFNDDHIQKGMKRRLTDQGGAGIIVTRDLTPIIEDWVSKGSDLWAVCRNPHGEKEGSIIIGPGNVDEALLCRDKDLWAIESFTNAVM